MTETETDYIETEAQKEAERVLADRDPEASDWRAAGYATALAAAETLVGDSEDPEVAKRAAEIVAEVIS